MVLRFKCTPVDYHTNTALLSLHLSLFPRITRTSNPQSPVMRLTFALGLLSRTLALPEPSATTIHKVPLSKGLSLTHANGRANIPAIFASVNATLAKFGGEPLPHYEPLALQQAKQAAEKREDQAKELVNVPLTDQPFYSLKIFNSTPPDQDLTYYGPVTIGSGDRNAQTFKLWVHHSV